jgi:arylsulfatase
VAFHRRGSDFADDRWELYHVDEDFSETRDLAGQLPDKLGDLVDTWWHEARRNKVLPLDDRGFAERAVIRIRPHSPRDRTRFVYLNGMHHIGNAAAPPIAGRSYEIRAEIDRPRGTENGVIIAHGSWNSGYCLMVEDGRLVYDFNYYTDHYVLRSTQALPPGRSGVCVRFQLDGSAGTSGVVMMSIDGQPVGEMRLPHTFEYFVSFQGLDVGADRLSPVRQGGSGEFPFTGGLEQVTIELLADSEARAGSE